MTNPNRDTRFLHLFLLLHEPFCNLTCNIAEVGFRTSLNCGNTANVSSIHTSVKSGTIARATVQVVHISCSFGSENGCQHQRMLNHNAMLAYCNCYSNSSDPFKFGLSEVFISGSTYIHLQTEFVSGFNNLRILTLANKR